jgi:putative transposase
VFKFKLEPNAEQQRMFNAFASARRFVHNWGLNSCREYYKETGQGISWKQLSEELTALNNQPDIKRAFVNFFQKRAHYPRFRRRSEISVIA